MANNVLIGLPLNSSTEAEAYFRNCVMESITKCERIDCFRSIDDFVHLIHQSENEYSLLVLFDELGMKKRYIPFLDDYLKKHSGTACIFIIPDNRQGSPYLLEMLNRGYLNGLFASDVNGTNIGDLFYNSRTLEQAAFYYGVEMPRPASLTDSSENGKVAENDDSDKVSVRYINGVKISRICACDVKGSEFGGYEGDKSLDYLSKPDMGLGLCGLGMKVYEFPLEPEWMQKYKQELNNYYITQGLMDFQAFENGRADESEFRSSVTKAMEKFEIAKEQKQQLLESFMQDKKSYGKIDVMINTEDVTDIRLLAPDIVNVQIRGVWYKSNVTFASREEYDFFINRVCTKNKMALNNMQAVAVFSDTKTNDKVRLRFTAQAGLLNSNEMPTMHIRISPKIKKTAAQLVEEGYWTEKQAGFLINAVRNGRSIIISGESGSGKTIGLNCLLEYAPDNVCGAVVQESGELFSYTKPNLEFLQTVNVRGEGKLTHDLKEIATAALLKNAQLFVIGEIKGDEAEDFSTAAYTGAQSITTTHSLNVYEGLPRIADLGRGTKGMSQKQLLERLSRCIDIVVQMDKYKVVTIAGVVGWDSVKEDVIYDIYEF